MNGALGGILGFLIALGLMNWFGSRRDEKKSGLRRAGETLLVVAAAAIGAAAAGFGTSYLRGYANQDAVVERTMEAFGQLPLVGVIMDDVPSGRERLREALEHAFRSGSGMEEVRALVVGWKHEYGNTAIRGAEDHYILSMWQAHRDVVSWLSTHSPKYCAEYFLTGLQNAYAPGEEFTPIFNRYLRAAEAAYHDGKGKPAHSALAEDEFGNLMVDFIGLTEDDFAVMEAPSTFSERRVCDISEKVSTGIDAVTSELRPAFARDVLTAQ